MLEPALEELLEETTRRRGDLEVAREEFHRRTGAFSTTDPWHEERIRAFFDWYLCEWAAELGAAPIARACRAAQRGLYRVTRVEDDVAWLACAISGVRVRVPTAGAAGRLRLDDVFDGRVIALVGRLWLAPGAIFHPIEAREPIERLLERAREAGDARIDVLDGLLRIRMRLARFTSMKPRHLYRYEALRDAEILSAAWARRAAKEQ